MIQKSLKCNDGLRIKYLTIDQQIIKIEYWSLVGIRLTPLFHNTILKLGSCSKPFHIFSFCFRKMSILELFSSSVGSRKNYPMKGI